MVLSQMNLRISRRCFGGFGNSAELHGDVSADVRCRPGLAEFKPMTLSQDYSITIKHLSFSLEGIIQKKFTRD